MLLNYIKIAWRNLLKSTTFSLINIGGLALGLTVALLISQYVRFELSYERSNPISDQIVRLSIDYLNGKAVDGQDAETYPQLGPRAMREMSEIEQYTRAYPLRNRLASVRMSDKYYQLKNVYAVDSSFFRMFNYRLVRGDQKDLFSKPRQAVVTERMAMTYFKTLDVIGKTLVIPRSTGDITLEVRGVVPDSPLNTHFKFDMLLSYPTMLSDFGEREDDWSNNNIYTFLQLTQGTSYQTFTTALGKFSDRLVTEKIIQNERVIAQKIGDIHLFSHKTFETETNNEAHAVFFLLGVAMLVLLGAFVNYVTLTTARTLDRAREIGVRKSVGSTQSQIRTQVLVETTLINVVAVCLAVLLVFLLRTSFLRLAGLPEELPLFHNSFFWGSVGVFLVVSVVFSGAYPAIVLAGFEPAKVLKGSFAQSAKGAVVRKLLVVSQFTITMILLVHTFVVYRQVEFLRGRDLGLNTDRTLVVKSPIGVSDTKQYAAFQNLLLNQSKVESVSFSSTVPGMGSIDVATTTGVNLSGVTHKNSHNYYIAEIDTSFIKLMSIRLLAGKNFDAETRPTMSDTLDRQLIVNLETLRLWGINNPQQAIGRRVDLWGGQATVRGVINNYHYLSPKDPHIPIIHFYSPSLRKYASVKFTGGDPSEQLAILRLAFEASFPHSPFNYFFLDNEYDKQYKSDDRFREVFTILTAMAIVISCLGLFGLATYTASKRTKEIGIRKVIGATTASLVALLSKEFLKLVGISIFIGIPVTYFLATIWLANYAYRTELTYYVFVAPAALILFMAFIAIGGKTISTALLNPVKSLRSE